MTLEERAVLSAGDDRLRNELISEYRGFILSCASRTLKRSVTDSDDEFSIAMIAFNEAIDSYNADKGKFLTFASLIIRNRVIDSIRRTGRNSTIPFSSMESTDEDGEIIEFEAPSDSDSDLKWEIEALTEQLDKFGISFFALAEVSPKSRKTKSACYSAAKYIIDTPLILNSVVSNGVLPVKAISEGAFIKKKVLERHRQYIITMVIVLTQDYPCIAGYFDMKEV